MKFKRPAIVLIVALSTPACQRAASPTTTETGGGAPLVERPRRLFGEARLTIERTELSRVRWGNPDEALVDRAVGLDERGETDALDVAFEAGLGQDDEKDAVRAEWAVVEDERFVLTTEERISRLESLRNQLANQLADDLVNEGVTDDRAVVIRDASRSVDDEIARVRRPQEDPPQPALDARDRQELDLREGEVVVDVCGALLPPAHLPRQLLKQELIDVDVDRATFAEDVRAHRAATAREATSALLATLAPLGARPITSSDREACVTVALPSRSAVLAAAELAGVRRVRIADRPTSAYAEADFTGDEVRLATQIQQFWDSGFDGETPSTRGFNDLTVGIVDEGFQDNHIGYLDTSSAGSTGRIKGRFHCSGAWQCAGSPTDCVPQSNLQWETGFSGIGDSSVDHGTTIAGILVSDFMDGQDPTGTLLPASDFSGYVPEGGVVFLQGDDSNSCGNRSAAIQRGADLNVDVLSMSVCAGSTKVCADEKIVCSHDCRCDGDDGDLNLEVNQTFKDGILTIKAAGNNRATTPGCCECTVSSPGDAEGALSVGGHGDSTDTALAPRDVIQLSTSSRGRRELRQDGGAREGTVVAISAPRVRLRTTSCEVDDELTCFLRTGVWTQDCFCTDAERSLIKTTREEGTSFATPTVAAAALLMKDAWIASGTPTTWLDQAEILKLRVLANGDRVDSTSGARRLTGLSGDFGVGRMRMRMLNAAGMDSPWYSKSGWNTISDGAGVQKWISDDGTAKPLSTDVETVKVLAWWYEPRTESGGVRAAHITMKLDTFDSTCTTLISSRSDVSYDTKKMIWDGSDIGGRCLRLEIFGDDVTADDENANAHSRRVNWMWVYEDNDRDDGDGPVGCTSTGVPEDCVEAL